jgi:Vitamin K-dependent gamma-carboxylase
MKPRLKDREQTPIASVSPNPPVETPSDGWVKSWDRFWFAPADPIGLGFVRVIGGLLILYVHFSYTFDLLSYVGGDRAWVDQRAAEYLRKESEVWVPGFNWTDPHTLHNKGTYMWSVFYHVSEPAWIYTIHFALLGVMVLFTIGLWTRITTVLTWMACLCYIQRTQTLLFGQDTMMMLLLFYLMIGPGGATLSVDRWLEIWRARKRFGPGYTPPVQPSVSANVALRCMQVNFCIIYLAAGTSKMLGPRWWSGTALWYCFANYSFAPMNVGLYSDMLVFLCQHRWLWELVMSGSAAFTLALELGFPFLVWYKHLRWFMVIGAVLLHTGIGLVMGLVTFSMFMLCLLVAFIPPEAIRHLLTGMAQSFKGPWQDKSGKQQKPGKLALAMSRR